MPIHYHIVDLAEPPSTKPLVLAIGNLDGVHLGHQALIKTAKGIADAYGYACAALTFTPHPREYFNPALRPLTLMRSAGKIKALQELGAEKVIFAKFDHRLAKMEPEEFITHFCIDTLDAHHIVTGNNFYFGRNRRGDIELLEHVMHQQKRGYTCVEPVYSVTIPPAPGGDVREGTAAGVDLSLGSASGNAPPLPPPQAGGVIPRNTNEEHIISSSRIRQVLSGGNVEVAAKLLGRPFALEGRVNHGDKRGRELGFPTANIPMHGLYLPAFGVYAVKAHVDGQILNGVANLGIRPTFGSGCPGLEVHLFDVDEDLYGKRLNVELHHYLRPEQAFDDKEMLISQIQKDMIKAKQCLTSNP